MSVCPSCLSQVIYLLGSKISMEMTLLKHKVTFCTVMSRVGWRLYSVVITRLHNLLACQWFKKKKCTNLWPASLPFMCNHSSEGLQSNRASAVTLTLDIAMWLFDYSTVGTISVLFPFNPKSVSQKSEQLF